MNYKLVWNDGITKGEFEIYGEYDYIINEWDKVRCKYPQAVIVWWGHYVYGAWVEIGRAQ